MQDQEVREGSSRVLSRGTKGMAAVAAVVGALLLGGLGAAVAQNDTSPTSTTTPGAAVLGPDGGRHRGPGGMGRHGAMGPGKVVHGEFVARHENGFRTLAVQTGKVTATNPTSITVRSDDGFSRTYIVNDKTRVRDGQNGDKKVKEGDEVRILALVEGDKATALQIGDVTDLKAGRGQRRPAGQAGQPAA